MDKGRLEQLLAAAGPAHHQAYIETDGDDPEWPLWYAAFLVDDLSKTLGRRVTQSQLVFHLIDMERQRSREAPDAAWPDYYAQQLAARAENGDL